MKHARWRRLFVAGAAALMAAALPVASRAAVRVDASISYEAAHAPRLDIDVWTNKEEGGVYRQGEPMRVFFRARADAYVLIYNIDTEGYIHLVYPYDPGDPDMVEGGRTYQVPSRNDPYDLVADGPTGMEYLVAIASPEPFRDLPWYLTGGYEGRDRGEEYGDDDEGDSGVIVGDPYIGMDRVVRRVVPRGLEGEVATADTYFYIERKVDYPRYVCADCHSYGGWFDPYGDVCSVVDIRIDAGWAHYRPLRSRILRPRYFYMVRSTAPTRYRQWKDRWSSVDGRATLRTRFQVDGTDKFQSRRQMIQRRTPPEFQRFRSPREGRVWRPDEVLRRNGGDARGGDVRGDDQRRRQWFETRERRQNDNRQQNQQPDDRRQIRERRDDQRQQQGRDEQRGRDRGRVEDRRQERQDRDQARQRDDRSQDRGDRGDRGRSEERRRDDNGRGQDRRDQGEGGWGHRGR